MPLHLAVDNTEVISFLVHRSEKVGQVPIGVGGLPTALEAAALFLIHTVRPSGVPLRTRLISGSEELKRGNKRDSDGSAFLCTPNKTDRTQVIKGLTANTARAGVLSIHSP